MDWLYGRQVVRLACAGGAKRRPRTRAGTAEGRAWLAAHGADAGLPVERLTPADLQRLTGSREHQGLACQVGDYPYAAPADAIAADLLVVLDEVSDPRNLGAVARSALAAGAGALALPRHRSAAVTPAAVKASAGATEHLDVAHVGNLVAFLAECKQAGHWVYGAAGEAAHGFDELDLGGRVTLVFGAEGRGLRPLVRRACDDLGAIPMEGPVDSLNVSVAAALFLYEVRRQRTAAAGGPARREPRRGGAG